MISSHFSLDQLRVLDAVVRQGSFAAAGQALGRATSAVSYGISRLEEELGLSLFVREGRKAQLTEAGHSILLEARTLLERAEELSVRAKELRGQWETRLSVVVDGCLPLGDLMRAVQALKAVQAPTEVTLVREYLSGVKECFDKGNFDLMVSIDFSGDAEHVAEPLSAVKLWLMAPMDHSLGGREVSRAELASEVELVVCDSGKVTKTVGARLSLGSPRVIAFSDFATKLSALRSGLGIGWMPEHLCRPYLDSGELCRLTVEGAKEHIFVPHLLRRRRQPLGRAARLFVDRLRYSAVGE